MANDNEYGAFLPTTDSFDRSMIGDIDASNSLKDFLVRLYQTTNNIALAVNVRTAGFHVEEEFVNGNLWFANKSLSSLTSSVPELRQELTKVIDFGALLDAAPKSVLHGITLDSAIIFTHISATATDTAGFTALPIPYAHVTPANCISIDINATHVIITTGIDRTAYDTCLVVLKFIRG